MIRRTKITLLVGGAVLALAGVGTGLALAQGSNPSPPPAPPSSTAPAPSSVAPAPPGMHHGRGPHCNGHRWDGHRGPGGLLARIQHGEATVSTNSGYQVIDIQRGTVESVNPGQLTVRSADGFSATYTVDSSTKIRKNRKAVDINQVVVNDRVTVLATKSGDTATATHINDIGPAR